MNPTLEPLHTQTDMNDFNLEDLVIKPLTPEEEEEQLQKEIKEYCEENGYIRMVLTREEYEWLQELAAERSTGQRYGYDPSMHQSTQFKKWMSGLKGELAVANYLETKIDPRYRRFGDNGIDFYWDAPPSEMYPDSRFSIDVKTVTQGLGTGFAPEWRHPMILGASLYIYCRTPRHGSQTVYIYSWLDNKKVRENLVVNQQGYDVIRDYHFDMDAKPMNRRVTYRMADFKPHFGVEK